MKFFSLNNDDMYDAVRSQEVGVTDADGISRWAVVVDAVTRRVLRKTPLTFRQSPPRGRGT